MNIQEMQSKLEKLKETEKLLHEKLKVARAPYESARHTWAGVINQIEALENAIELIQREEVAA